MHFPRENERIKGVAVDTVLSEWSELLNSCDF